MGRSKEKEITAENIHEWLGDNYIWLTEWMTNVVTIRESEAKTTSAIFQTFVAPIMSDPPNGMIAANNDLKALLIMATVFGVPVAPVKARENAPLSSAQVGDYKTPACFAGFRYQTGRLPIEGDIALFTATKWFELSFKQRPIMVIGGATPRGHSMLETVCTVEFFPKEVVQS